MMLLQLGRYEQTGGVDLVQPASGFVVAVDGVGGVVEDDDGGLGHYIKIFQKEGFDSQSVYCYKFGRDMSVLQPNAE